MKPTTLCMINAITTKEVSQGDLDGSLTVQPFHGSKMLKHMEIDGT